MQPKSTIFAPLPDEPASTNARRRWLRDRLSDFTTDVADTWHMFSVRAKILALIIVLVALRLGYMGLAGIPLGGTPSPHSTYTPAAPAAPAAPGASFARQVGTKLVTLNTALQDVMATNERLRGDPALLYSRAWADEWLKGAFAARTAANDVRALVAPADGADLKATAVAAADNAIVMLTHMARNVDAIKAGDDATARTELSLWTAALDAYEQQIMKVTTLAP